MKLHVFSSCTFLKGVGILLVAVMPLIASSIDLSIDPNLKTMPRLMESGLNDELVNEISMLNNLEGDTISKIISRYEHCDKLNKELITCAKFQ